MSIEIVARKCDLLKEGGAFLGSSRTKPLFVTAYSYEAKNVVRTNGKCENKRKAVKSEGCYQKGNSNIQKMPVCW